MKEKLLEIIKKLIEPEGEVVVMERKFVTGDKVIIKPDLKVGKITGKDVYVNVDMQTYAGQEGTVTKVYDEIRYKLDIDDEIWYWTDEMLNPVNDLKIGDFVTIRPDLEDYKGTEFDVVGSMLPYANSVAEIVNVIDGFHGIRYELDVDNGDWRWKRELLLTLPEELELKKKIVSSDFQEAMEFADEVQEQEIVREAFHNILDTILDKYLNI